MKNKILVPVDFSTYATNAAKVAVMMASFYEDKVCLFHVVGAPILQDDTMITSINDFVSVAEEKMKDMVEELKKVNYHNDVEITTKIEVGFSVDLLCHEAQTGEYDIVIMGTHGASGLKKAFIGSVASAVLDKTSSPLMLIPEHYKFNADTWSLESILFTVDNTFTNNHFLVVVEAFAKNVGATLNCLKVEYTAGDTIDDSVVTYLNDYKVDTLYIVEKDKGSIAESINGYAKNNGIDLISMVHHERTFFEKLTSKSLSKEMLFNPSVPLLIFKDSSKVGDIG